ncbi:hypothetical protein ANCCAN_20984 [Ancylostoma caninum]|uniref:SCP domain-containing protein n=1 Tax=Ancylostoma caninum TaxID=29170 RepID=A0A368FQT1_ANCCA|nr:hypothetical protein ANCCAN_20984 [Ancylostoma caninum]
MKWLAIFRQNQIGLYSSQESPSFQNWSCELELKAQDRIKNCDGDVEGFGSWSANSIRYKMVGADRSRPKPLIERALRTWWEEGSALGKNNKYTGEAMYHFGNVCEYDHFLCYT